MKKKTISSQLAQERADRLTYVRQLAQLSRAELSEVIGYSPDTIYRWEKGTFLSLNQKVVPAIIEKLKSVDIICSPEWLLEGEGLPPYRNFAEAKAILTPKEQEELTIEREAELFKQLNPNAIGLFVTDDTMAPEFLKGDYVAGVTTRIESNIIGKPCIVAIEGAPTPLIRNVERGSRNEIVTLLCTNPNEQYPVAMQDVSIVEVAPIIWWRRPKVTS